MTATTTAPAAKRTSADRILDIFRDVNTATVRDIMTVTDLGKTTVNDNLRKLAASGDMIRMDVDGVATWQLTPTRKAANKKAADKLAKAAAKAKAKTAPRLTDEDRAMAAPTPKPRKQVAANAETTRTTVTADATADTLPPTRTPTGRRVKGLIEVEILNFLATRPGESFGSYQVAKEIGSAAGAAYVALKRMDRKGDVVLVQSGPDRYALPS